MCRKQLSGTTLVRMYCYVCSCVMIFQVNFRLQFFHDYGFHRCRDETGFMVSEVVLSREISFRDYYS